MLDNGAVLLIVCFDCGIKTIFVKNTKDYRLKIKKYIDNKKKCKNCGNSRIYVRDGDGNVINE
jgi:hypothetical protein